MLEWTVSGKACHRVPNYPSVMKQSGRILVTVYYNTVAVTIVLSLCPMGYVP